MNKWLLGTMVVGLVAAGCDNGKKAAEEAAAVAASVKEMTEKKAEEAAAAAKAQAEKAKAEADKALAEKREGVAKGFQDQLEAFDRKLDFLKEKASKLKGPAKVKAEGALAAVDKLRTEVVAAVASLKSGDLSSLPALGEKVTASLSAAQASLAEFESAALGKK
jgi:hypothetical protein